MMMTRRHFTITVALTPLASWIGAGCGGDDAGGYVDGEGATATTSPTIPCDGLGALSNVAEGHAHELCVPANDLALPPSGRVTYATTTAEEHFHTVTLDAAQLAAINRGDALHVTTSTVEGHVHDFSLARSGTLTPLPLPLPSDERGGGA